MNWYETISSMVDETCYIVYATNFPNSKTGGCEYIVYRLGDKFYIEGPGENSTFNLIKDRINLGPVCTIIFDAREHEFKKQLTEVLNVTENTGR